MLVCCSSFHTNQMSLHMHRISDFLTVKVVIPIHTSNSKSMEFWKQHNPEVHAMAASAKVISPLHLSERRSAVGRFVLPQAASASLAYSCSTQAACPGPPLSALFLPFHMASRSANRKLGSRTLVYWYLYPCIIHMNYCWLHISGL